MLIADVNVLIYAFRRESPRHAAHREWLLERLAGPEPFGVSELALSGFLRVVTNHRIYNQPSTLEKALEFCDSVLAAPASVGVRPSAHHWSIFRRLCRAVRATSNIVPDAYHAALAIDHGATWVTNDHGFGRFPGLRWTTPLQES